MKIDRIKNISKDFVLNLIASVILTAVLQLIVYPQLAQLMGSNNYGVLLTMTGLANTFAATIGSSLNNTRLLLNTDYEEKKIEGDFLPLLLITNILSIIVLFIVSQRYESNQFTNILLVLYMAANGIRTYGSVTYRIRINYTKNLICSTIVAIGDLVGLVILNLLKDISFLWPICFLIGEIAAIYYINASSHIFKEKMSFTHNFSLTLRKDGILMTATLTANLLIYLDRILLLPILGGTAVTTYTVASVFGKSIGILMTPLAGVLLSYFSQKDFSMSKKGLLLFTFVNISVSVIFLLVCHIIGAWFTGIIYPTEIENSIPYIDIANAAAIVVVLSSMTQPTVLRYAPSYWLLIIQITYSLVYLVGGYFAVKQNGLMGFSYIALVAACIKFVLQFVAGMRYVEREIVQ